MNNIKKLNIGLGLVIAVLVVYLTFDSSGFNEKKQLNNAEDLKAVDTTFNKKSNKNVEILSSSKEKEKILEKSSASSNDFTQNNIVKKNNNSKVYLDKSTLTNSSPKKSLPNKREMDAKIAYEKQQQIEKYRNQQRAKAIQSQERYKQKQKMIAFQKKLQIEKAMQKQKGANYAKYKERRDAYIAYQKEQYYKRMISNRDNNSLKN